MAEADPLDLTLCDAAEALADGHLRAEALVEAALDRVGTLDPVLNAFVSVEAEAARARAKALDAARVAGQAPGPLAGVPLAHKDMFHRAGLPCAYGSPLRAGFVPKDTAAVIVRLEAAGQVQIGRLRMSELAMGPTGHNAHEGRVRNPWAPERISGGSSSGSAAVVAARLVFGALGSDTGGSIRLPAAMCGVVGLKPTQGRVPVAGAMPLAASLDCFGPLARAARDAGRLLDVIAGPGGFEAAAMADPAGLRIGVPEGFYTEDLAADVAVALEAAIAIFEHLGVPCRPVTVPDQPACAALATLILSAEAASLHLEDLRDRPDGYGPQVRARLLQGLAVGAPHYLRALQLRALHQQAMQAGAFSACDALLAPVMRGTVPTGAETDVGAGPAMAATLAGLSDLTRPANFLGLPALAMPAGFDGNGLPVGLQLIGRPGEERVLLALAGAFGRATDWARRRPPLVPG